MVLALILAKLAVAAQPVASPLFLKQGFSTVLEFSSVPKRIVIGDSQSFQVERMERSLVVRALVANASGNLFVYLQSGEPRVFLLTASDDAEPTLFRKFEEPAQAEVKSVGMRKGVESGIFVRAASFDKKKDFLTVDATLLSDGSRVIRPAWEKARLKFKAEALAPTKLWAERREVQRDSKIRARFVFLKPNLPRNLNGAILLLPLIGEPRALSVELGRK